MGRGVLVLYITIWTRGENVQDLEVLNFKTSRSQRMHTCQASGVRFVQRILMFRPISTLNEIVYVCI